MSVFQKSYIFVLSFAFMCMCPIWASETTAYWAHKVGVKTDIAYGPNTQQSMDIFIQGSRLGEVEPGFEVDLEVTPLIVWIHGGGGMRGDKSTEISWLVPYLRRGWNAVALNYRTGPGTAIKALDDVLCGYKRALDVLESMNIMFDRIIVSGASAGGQLALLVGMTNASGEHPCKLEYSPNAIVNWFGISDMESFLEYSKEFNPEKSDAELWIGESADKAKRIATTSPLYLISDETPPIISVHGDQDTRVPFEQATALHESLDSQNELVTLQNGNHSGFSDQQYAEAYDAIFDFLEAL